MNKNNFSWKKYVVVGNSDKIKALNCKWRRSCPGWGVIIGPLNEAVCISIEFPLLYKEVRKGSKTRKPENRQPAGEDGAAVVCH